MDKFHDSGAITEEIALNCEKIILPLIEQQKQYAYWFRVYFQVQQWLIKSTFLGAEN